MCALCRDKPSAAVAELQSCVDAAAAAADGQALLALGLALLQSGRAGEAVPRLEAAVKAERDFERAKEAVAVLAEAYRGAGKKQDATTRYTHVIEMGGRVARVASGHRGLGLAALSEGGPEQLDAAAAHFQQSVAVAADSAASSADAAQAMAMAHRLHALVLRRQGLWEESAAAFKRAVECDDSDAAVAAAQLGLALSQWRGGDVAAAADTCASICAGTTAPPHLKSRAEGLAAALAAARSDAQQALELGLAALAAARVTATAAAGNGNVDETALHAVVAWAQRKAGSVRDSVTHYEHATRCLASTPGTSDDLSRALFGANPEAVLELLLGQAMLAYARAQPEAHSAGAASSGVDEAEVREQQEEHACDRIERALILTEGSLGAETEGTRERSIAVSCYRELGLHAGFHARYAEATEYLSKAVELDASDAEAQFQLATALGYVDRSEESDEHYQIALELRSGTPAPEPHEQARQLAIGLMQEAEEARAFFYEVTSARRVALADLPKKLPWALWTRVGLFE
jgi:tetratricopeptide (TPR) repeat protein